VAQNLASQVEHTTQQLQVPKTLDVEVIERQLLQLWRDSAEGPREEGTGAVMRARVANVIIFTASDANLSQINLTLADFGAVHPCRALVVVADRTGTDQDIEMYVASFCQARGQGGGKRVCCEEVTFVARGQFVAELPSAVLPLVVADLPTFLCWHDRLDLNDRVFDRLLRASDRLIVDTADSQDSYETLLAVSLLIKPAKENEPGVSDINWARLTSWRALMASFYDAERYRNSLDHIDTLDIDYANPAASTNEVAPQALLYAGWFVSRLGWDLSATSPQQSVEGVRFEFNKADRRLALNLKRVDHPSIKPGRLARAELICSRENASFRVIRSESGQHIETQATLGGDTQPGRVLPVRNRTTAQLLAKELEILGSDLVYAEAVSMAVRMIGLISR